MYDKNKFADAKEMRTSLKKILKFKPLLIIMFETTLP